MVVPAVRVERRRDLESRAVFDEVYARVETFFDPARTWGGAALRVLAGHVVRESHPELDALQVQALVMAVQRVRRGAGRGPAVPAGRAVRQMTEVA